MFCFYAAFSLVIGFPTQVPGVSPWFYLPSYTFLPEGIGSRWYFKGHMGLIMSYSRPNILSNTEWKWLIPSFFFPPTHTNFLKKYKNML